MAEIPYISLFAGVAGLDLAVRIAIPGARCIGFCEREFAAIEVLESRIEEGSIEDAPIFTDVRSFPSELYRGQMAGIVAGFPCPDYSVAGKRAGIVGKHGQLWWELHRIIEEVDPLWVFLENVPGLYTADESGGRCVCGRPVGWGGMHSDTGEPGEEQLYPEDRRGDDLPGVASSEWVEEQIRRYCESLSEGNDEVGFGLQVDNARAGDGVLPGEGRAVPATEAEAGGDWDISRGIIPAGLGREAPKMDARNKGRVREGAERDPSIESEGSAGRDGRTESNCPACGQSMDDEDGGSFRGALGEILWSLAYIGFDAKWMRLAASDVGASHGRKRWFCLAYRPGRGLRIGGEPSGGGGLTNRSNAELADTANDHGRRGDSGAQAGTGENGIGRRGSASGISDVGNAERTGREEPRIAGWGESAAQDGLRVHDRPERSVGILGHPDQPGLQGRIEREHGTDQRVTGAAGDSELAGCDCGYRYDPFLHLFAPGPSDPRWPAILRDFPWLAPAISEEEVIAAVRGMAPGIAYRVDFEDRTDRLRSLGNLACPIQAACALIVLARRARIAE